jgi:hypothetical protein
MIIGTLLVPIGLFLYGWGAEKQLHWIVPIIGTAILGGAMMIVFVRCTDVIYILRVCTDQCRCLVSRTSWMLIPFMQHQCPPLQRSSALFWGLYCLLLGMQCMMCWVLGGVLRSWGSLLLRASQFRYCFGCMVSVFGLADSPRLSFECGKVGYFVDLLLCSVLIL